MSVPEAAVLMRRFMESLGVFGFDEGNIGELLIGQCESNASFRGPGIDVDGISLGAVQFVVTKRIENPKIS